MSTYTSAGPGAEPGDWRQSQNMGNWGRFDGRSRRCGFGASWHPFELLAMILGFIVFWPIGLGILAYKFWQRKNGSQGTFMHAAWDTWAGVRQAGLGTGFASWGARRGGWRPGASWGMQGAGPTGNSAFDDWRASELARLEEERRKLEASEREFADYIANLRRAKDREEFERFMNARRAPTNPPTSGPGPEVL